MVRAWWVVAPGFLYDMPPQSTVNKRLMGNTGPFIIRPNQNHICLIIIKLIIIEKYFFRK